MPTINQLPVVDSVQSGDQLPIYSASNGDARRSSVNTLMTYIQGALSTLASLSVTGRLSAGYLSRSAPVTKTANFALGSTENWVVCNGASANVTVTLPTASDWVGREVMLKNISGTYTVISASSNVVPLVGGSAGTAILGATAGAWVTLVSDGVNWIAMQGA